MSIQRLTVQGFTVSGTPDDPMFFDISINHNLSVVMGYQAARKNEGWTNAIYGYQAGLFSRSASSNIFMGYRAGEDTDGNNNVFVGTYTGSENGIGTDNVYLGNDAGRHVIEGFGNTFLGSFTGKELRGMDSGHNVLMGFSNSTLVGAAESNVVLGALADVLGAYNVALGHANSTKGECNTVLGSRNLLDTGTGSIVFGHGVINTGSDALIALPGCGRVEGSDRYLNTANEHLNIANRLTGDRRLQPIEDGTFPYRTRLSGDDVYISIDDDNHVRVSPAEINIRSLSNVLVETPTTRLLNETTVDDLVVNGFINNTGPSVFNSNIFFVPPDGSSNWWTQYIDTTSSVDGVTELVFQSRHGYRTSFTDEFHAEVLNFTGKHRCVFEEEEEEEEEGQRKRGTGKEKMRTRNTSDDARLLDEVERLHVGKVVIATGKYRNLEGHETIAVDEAIPVVALCRAARDKRAFGVVGGVDRKGAFRLGNLRFDRSCDTNAAYAHPRVIVQSAGEGAIWVCDLGGPIRNGDLVTTSPVPGIGMRQKGCHVANYTVARATCDAFTDKVNADKYTTTDNGGRIDLGRDRDRLRVRKAYIGCVYLV
jgi:hypothetical protein